MKYFSYTLAVLLLALSFTGCASDPYARDTLIEIPNYPAHERLYDKSARLAVYPTLGIAHTIAEQLSLAGYNVIDTKAIYQSGFVSPDWIIEPLYIIPSRLTYNEETYLYSRIIVSVRPAYDYSEEHATILPNKDRIFQTHSRYNFGVKDEVTLADYQLVHALAIENLLRNPAFCEAIEKKK